VRAGDGTGAAGADGRIGTEHLMLGLLPATDRPPVGRLAELGVTYERLCGRRAISVAGRW
jgi:hypothetical protein